MNKAPPADRFGDRSSRQGLKALLTSEKGFSMRKQHEPDDTKMDADSEANSATTRRPEPRSGGSQAGHDEGLACSSITLALNSHGEVSDCQWEALNGKAGLDYFETASTIHWTNASRHWFDLLTEPRPKVQSGKTSAAVPISTHNNPGCPNRCRFVMSMDLLHCHSIRLLHL